MQAYSDPNMAGDKWALPDVSIEWFAEGEAGDDGDGEPMPAGWYWCSCFPGCMPDSDWVGPFASAEDAESDAQDGAA